MLLKDFLENVYLPLRLLGRSQRTVILYRYSIELFSESLGRPAELKDLTDLVVSTHLATLLASGKRPAGVNKERSQLLALWNLAARKKYVDEFPEVRAVPEPEVIPVAWSIEELWRLRISCNYVPGDYDGVPANKWWLALHCVLWATGERISATMRMKFSAISGDSITFPAEDRKGSTKANVCRVQPYVNDAIDAIRKPERAIVFPWPHSETYLYRVYGIILKRAELDTSSRSKFHRMRRSHATHLKIAGGDPTQSLGHASPQTTEAYLDRRLLPMSESKLPVFGKARA